MVRGYAPCPPDSMLAEIANPVKEGCPDLLIVLSAKFFHGVLHAIIASKTWNLRLVPYGTKSTIAPQRYINTETAKVAVKRMPPGPWIGQAGCHWGCRDNLMCSMSYPLLPSPRISIHYEAYIHDMAPKCAKFLPVTRSRSRVGGPKRLRSVPVRPPAPSYA